MRKRYIDYLRVMSMLAVVMIHICTTAMTDFDNGVGNMNGVLFSSVTHIFRFAVPVFFMISGALLLNPKKEISLKKLLGYIWKYACVILIFCWAYAFIEIVFDNHNIRPIYLFQSFANMLQGKTWAHMWYMYSLLGVMLILPILRWTAKLAKGKEITYLVIILGLFLSVLPAVTNLTGFEIGVQFPIISVYVFHMLLGHWVDTEVIHWKNGVNVAVIGGCCLVLIISSYFSVMEKVDIGFTAGYYSPVMIVFAVALFMLIRNIGLNLKPDTEAKPKNRIGGGVNKSPVKMLLWSVHCPYVLDKSCV